MKKLTKLAVVMAVVCVFGSMAMAQRVGDWGVDTKEKNLTVEGSLKLTNGTLRIAGLP